MRLQTLLSTTLLPMLIATPLWADTDAPASLEEPTNGTRSPERITRSTPVPGLPAPPPATNDIHVLPPIVETLSLLLVMRSTEAYLWPDPFSFNRIDEWPNRYEQAFTMAPKFDSSRSFMEWDGDRWGINVIGHGLLGSELYLRPRRCGFGWLASFGYATAASAVWEYGFEANGVRPSGVDLWYTPLSGILFGEARFQAWRALDGVSNPAWRGILRGLFDPVGEFSTQVFGAPC